MTFERFAEETVQLIEQAEDERRETEVCKYIVYLLLVQCSRRFSAWDMTLTAWRRDLRAQYDSPKQ